MAWPTREAGAAPKLRSRASLPQLAPVRQARNAADSSPTSPSVCKGLALRPLFSQDLVQNKEENGTAQCTSPSSSCANGADEGDPKRAARNSGVDACSAGPTLSSPIDAGGMCKPHGLSTPAVARSFVISGNQEAANLGLLRSELTRRGYEEKAKSGPTDMVFDFCWGPKHTVDYNTLASHQLVNHFENDFELTVKSRLVQNIKDLHLYADMGKDSCYPGSYFLSSAEAIEEFSRDFKVAKAMCVLKMWVAHLAASSEPSETFEEGVVCVAFEVLKRSFESIDSVLHEDDNHGEMTDFSVKQIEWDVLQEVDFEDPSKPNAGIEAQQQERLKRRRARLLNRAITENRLEELRIEGEQRALKKSLQLQSTQRLSPFRYAMMKSNRSSPDIGEVIAIKSLTANPVPSQNSSPFKAARHCLGMLQETSVWDVDEEGPKSLSGSALAAAVHSVLKMARADPQFGLYEKNIWIVKPMDGFRGNGITVEKDFDRIVRRAKMISGGLVCQKYIENPLLVGGLRKHDLRQWALVTCLNPLTIWFYNEVYVRFAANDFSLSELDRLTHLTHNHVCQDHPDFDMDDEYWRCQRTLSDYRKQLQDKFGYDVWTQKILPQFKKIVVASIQCVQESLSKPASSSCCFQIFGYDFMVDEALNAWLIEVNDIPMMHGDGPVTERLFDTGLQDAISVVLDGEHGRTPCSPQFELIHRGPTIPKMLQVPARSLVVQGSKVAQPPPVTIVVQFDAPALNQKLRQAREAELQELAERKRQKEDKEEQKRQRQVHLKKLLQEKVLRRNVSDPCLTSLGKTEASAPLVFSGPLYK